MHSNLKSARFSFERVKISADLCSVLQYCQSLTLKFISSYFLCPAFPKDLKIFLCEEARTSLTWESVQKCLFEICKTLERAFATLTYSLLKNKSL